MSVKTKIKTISWSALGLCCVVLLVAAMKSKDSKACASVEINIEGATQHKFIKKADVLTVLNQNNINAGKTLEDIDLRKAEKQLEQNAWIKDAELFFDNHQTLHVNISEREPIARVFTMSGNSFYIDSTGLRLPVNENATARVLVFTSFPSDKKILSKPDSLVLNDIKRLTQYISADSFLNEQTAQTQSDIAPASVSPPSRQAAASIHAWVISSNRRRSTTSASAPAGKPTRNTGRLVAVCSSATSTAEDVSEVISQAAPTLCIQVPTLDATEAIQSARNTGWASGLHGELGAALTVDVADLQQAAYCFSGPCHSERSEEFVLYPQATRFFCCAQNDNYDGKQYGIWRASSVLPFSNSWAATQAWPNLCAKGRVLP